MAVSQLSQAMGGGEDDNNDGVDSGLRNRCFQGVEMKTIMMKVIVTVM